MDIPEYQTNYIIDEFVNKINKLTKEDFLELKSGNFIRIFCSKNKQIKINIEINENNSHSP